MPVQANLLLHLFFISAAVLAIFTSNLSNEGQAADNAVPSKDDRAAKNPKNLDESRVFSAPTNLTDWKKRKSQIRERILVSCGLAPLPQKPPLKAEISGKIDRDGYTIEKVSIQTFTGFYLSGNLYRPSSSVPAIGSRPGVLIAHGHWEDGRMANTVDGSIPARAITFARQGYVAFTYDMAGYNDTSQIEHRTFAAGDKYWLWGVSLMGLQTWNSIRALDFLLSLKDVDLKKIVITGESGGGTQTMMLGAIDDRLVAVAPCVMVSHSMQGGCLCENAPGLRIDFSNMDIAAAAAPKPQIMVGASGDWTRTMMSIEGPAVKSVYDLYGKSDELNFQLFQFNHNINKTSREAVYKFLGDKLLNDANPEHFIEPPYKMEPVSDLRVFPEGVSLPEGAISSEELTSNLIDSAKNKLARTTPTDAKSLAQFQKTYRPIWETTLALDIPLKKNLLASQIVVEAATVLRSERRMIGRRGKGDSIPTILFRPAKQSKRSVVIVAPGGMSELTTANNSPKGIAGILVESGFNVLLIDAFLTGSRADFDISNSRKRPFGEFFTTYNRTDLQERVQDLITAKSYLNLVCGMSNVQVIGMKEAGLWALLAAPAYDGAVADCNSTDLTNDEALLTQELYVPCLRKMGDFKTAGILAAPKPLFLHNTGRKFSASAEIMKVYGSAGLDGIFTSSSDIAEDTNIVKWMTLHR